MENNKTHNKMKSKLLLMVASLFIWGTMNAQEPHYSVNPYGYPLNMPVVAQININGVPQTSTQIELGAFLGTEVRGSKFINVYETQAGTQVYQAWIQIHYNTDEIGQSISFKIYDHTGTGTEYTTCYTTLPITANGYGSQGNPVVLNFLVPYTFTGTGNWSEASHWTGGAVPTEGSAVIIDGTCTLDSDVTMASVTVNEGKSLTVPNGKSLTATNALNTTVATQLVIQEGGQLFGNVAGAYATVEKGITAYTAGAKDHYYFISSPLEGSTARTEVTKLTSNDYDLYWFDQTEEYEWRNFKKKSSKKLEPGEGYLYANSSTITLGFAKVLNSTTTSVILTKEVGEDIDFSGWNLIGNPFSHTTYIDREYYRMNSEGSGLTTASASDYINVCEGVFVLANSDEETITFSNTAPSRGEELLINLTQNRGSVIDNARVRFDKGNQLPKFMLDENGTKIYFPQGNKEFAIVNSAAEAEMPLNFKASKNGSYTLSVDMENVKMDYLHLIDNMTGIDVDLLQTPSYTFEANTHNYASRFKLVFSATQVPEPVEGQSTFAFYNGSSWIVSNLGEATLQVVDVTGRIVSSETINGNADITLNQTPGVYMLRLVNGNNVKVQKVVVR